MAANRPPHHHHQPKPLQRSYKTGACWSSSQKGKQKGFWEAPHGTISEGLSSLRAAMPPARSGIIQGQESDDENRVLPPVTLEIALGQSVSPEPLSPSFLGQGPRARHPTTKPREIHMGC